MESQVVDDGKVLETVVSDTDLRRAHAAAEPPPPVDDGEQEVSEQVMTAYNKAKTAGEAQDARNRQTVEASRRHREGEAADVPVSVPAAGEQTAITDFGGAKK